MKTAEEILSEHTGEKGIYLTHGTIRGSDALDAMKEYSQQEVAKVFSSNNSLPFAKAMKFTKWFIENWEFIDDTTAGNVYAHLKRKDDTESCLTIEEIYKEWEAKGNVA